jgi:hypothetical protein
MISKELDNLKYRIYKKSWKADYITYKQFIENQDVSYTFWELKNKCKKSLEISKEKIKNK